MDLGGQPVLCRVVERLRRSAKLRDVVVATTNSPKDDLIVELCNVLSFTVFRGSENDVLDRYYHRKEGGLCV